MTPLEELFSDLDRLTGKQRSIAEYIMSHSEEAAYLPLKALSRRAGASEVSVLRMCKALGLDSFVALKDALRENNRQRLRDYGLPAFGGRTAEDERRGPLETLDAICEDDLRNLGDMIQDLDRRQLFDCVRGLLAAKEVVVFAHDASGLFADYLVYRLRFLRIQATSVKLGENASVQSAMARLGAEDYAVLLSFPPYHAPIRSVADYCHYRGTPTLVITDSYRSPAVTADSRVFLCKTAARYFYNSQTATVSFINILASCISLEMGPRFQEILAEEQDVSDFIAATGEGDRPESGPFQETSKNREEQ